ncbi:MAG: hypothetical protein HXL38_001120 [Candidatus Saccharimonas sp.]|nr:MAG: hypothetical protein HXL38_001120 [Candidatus Saccharimonas sp.]
MNKNQLNEDNIISAVARVALKTQESPKTGNLYTTITLHFKNGLEIRYFVDPKDKFGLKDAISRISQSDKIDNFLNED